MTSKRLPPAILTTAARRRETDAEEVSTEQSEPNKPLRHVAAESLLAEEVAAEPPSALDASGAPKGTSEPPPLTGTLLPPVTGGSDLQKKERRGSAEKIVDRYRLYATLGGLVPMPAVNVAGLTAINVRMVKALSDLYGLPFERNQTRSMIMGLIGGSVPTGLGFATASLVGLVVPAGAFVGLAVSSLSAGALTRNIGLVFIEYFESGVMPPAGATDGN